MSERLFEMLLQGAGVALGAVIAWIFNESRQQMVRLTDSVAELNIKMAQVLESLRTTKDQLSQHAQRIERLESVTMLNKPRSKAGARGNSNGVG